jgi:protein gp37
MADHSTIEWTEATWNPIAGCSVHSPGCLRCYAMKRVAPRLAKNPATPHYAGTVEPSKAGPVFTGVVNLASDDVVIKPLRWKRPRMIFVNSTSDLFHENVPDEWIDRIFAVMALSPQHTFQVLTKRAKRMRKYFSDDLVVRRIYELACEITLERELVDVILIAPGIDPAVAPPGRRVYLDAFPLPNVWLGVSAERQQEADERVPELLATPAAIRFVSAEPLLGPIDFTALKLSDAIAIDRGDYVRLDGLEHLDWIIVGGESGHGARPMHPAWARQIRDQCAAAGVPFFFKQWGEYPQQAPDGETFRRLGKKRAGRLLDGVEHNGMPAPREVPAL